MRLLIFKLCQQKNEQIFITIFCFSIFFLGIDAAQIPTDTKILSVPYYDQGDTNWCVPTSMAMIFNYYYGAVKNIHSWDIAQDWNWSRDKQWWNYFEPTSNMICDYFKNHGLMTAEKISNVNFDKIKERINIYMPLILVMKYGVADAHAVVVTGYSTDGNSEKVYINDPSGYLIVDKLSMSVPLPYVAIEVSWDSIAQYMEGILNPSYAIAVGSPVDQMPTYPSRGTIDIDMMSFEGFSFSYEEISIPLVYSWSYGLDIGIGWQFAEQLHPSYLTEKDLFIFNKYIANHMGVEKSYKLNIEFVKQGLQSTNYTTQSLSIENYSRKSCKGEVMDLVPLRNYLSESGEYTITLTLWNNELTEKYDEIELPPVEYKVTAEKPIASASDISGQPESMMPNVVYSVIAKYYDPDGRSNLKNCYLGLSHPSKPLTMMWHEPGDWYEPWEGEEGKNYLTITDVTSVEIDNGYQLTWQFKINDSWPSVSNAIDFGVRAWDDDDLKTVWNYDNTNASFSIFLTDFIGSPTSGPAPLTVNFTDHSTGGITSWSWDFGDGNTSSDQEPSHTYTRAGTFTVSLTVAGPGGSSTETKIGYISVWQAISPWPMFGHDPQHTCYCPYLGPQTSNIKWSIPISSPSWGAPSPTIDTDGTIYVGSDNKNLYAINPDGTIKWKYKTDHVIISSAAVGKDHTIYFGSNDGYLYALNQDGSLKWKYLAEGGIASSPLINGDTIYVGSMDGHLYAINEDGNLKWRFQTDRSIWKSSPAIDSDGIIYIGIYTEIYNGYLYAICPDGSLKWNYEVGNYVANSPSIGKDGTIYVYSNYLHAVNPDGSFRWKVYMGSGCTPAIGNDGTIYALGSFGTTGKPGLIALNPDGSLKWRYPTEEWQGFCGTMALGSDNTIYVASNGAPSWEPYKTPGLYAISQDGTLKWAYEIPLGACGSNSPELTIGYDGTLYGIYWDGLLYAFGGFAPLSPPNSSHITSTPTFQWSPAPDALYYHLVVARDSTFSDIIWNQPSIPSDQASIKYNGSTLLEPGQIYYWKMQYQDRDLNWSDWTAIWSFTIDNVATLIYEFSQIGWYMVSLPVIPADSSVSTLFPSAMSGKAYSWNVATSAYDEFNKVEPKKGYWLAIPEATSDQVSGQPLNTYTEHFDSEGWYMIGSVTGSVDFTNPDDNPDGMVISPAFGWNADIGEYFQTTTLDEKNGYWVAVLQECDLNIGGQPLVQGLSKVISTGLLKSAFYSSHGEAPPMPPDINWETGELVIIPKEFRFYQNYPNPFNPVTTITFDLPRSSRVEIVIYNILGQKVKTLVDKDFSAGKYEITWEGINDLHQSVASGIYLCRIKAGEFMGLKKLVLVQ